jgi:TonB family protein
MQEKTNLSALFDRSGSLTIRAMELYLRGDLNQAEMEVVEKHLDQSPFDREAMEGILKHAGENISLQVEELKGQVNKTVPKVTNLQKLRIRQRTYWYSAAGILLLAGLSILLIFMLRGPRHQNQLAVNEPAVVNENVTGNINPEQNQSFSENDRVPVTEQKLKINDSNPDKEIGRKDLTITQEVNEEIQSERNGYNIIEPGKDLESEVIDEEIIIMPDYDVAAEEADSEQVFLVVESMPDYPGGEEKLYKFLEENIKYPQLAKESGIQGRVFVTFAVEKDGSITNIRVLRGIGGGCDEEAIRVVKAMPKWIPGRQRGKPVKVQYNLPVKFTLN